MSIPTARNEVTCIPISLYPVGLAGFENLFKVYVQVLDLPVEHFSHGEGFFLVFVNGLGEIEGAAGVAQGRPDDGLPEAFGIADVVDDFYTGPVWMKRGVTVTPVSGSW
jgi:hypothetical protein